LCNADDAPSTLKSKAVLIFALLEWLQVLKRRAAARKDKDYGGKKEIEARRQV
jgi:hypothetical protein